jgi:hypothetical protein
MNHRTTVIVAAVGAIIALLTFYILPEPRILPGTGVLSDDDMGNPGLGQYPRP